MRLLLDLMNIPWDLKLVDHEGESRTRVPIGMQEQL